MVSLDSGSLPLHVLVNDGPNPIRYYTTIHRIRQGSPSIKAWATTNAQFITHLRFGLCTSTSTTQITNTVQIPKGNTGYFGFSHSNGTPYIPQGQYRLLGRAVGTVIVNGEGAYGYREISWKGDLKYTAY
jgi:hypothetical protein